MSNLTEVYFCKKGQKLKHGKLDVRDDLANKSAAKADALSRCRKDPSIFKVAYYRIKEDGDFKTLFSYTNPNCVSRQKPDRGNGRKPVKKKKKGKKKKISLISRIKAAFK